MSIVDDLNKINNIKNEIKYAIRDKGVEMKDDTPFAEYPNCIRNISGGSDSDSGSGGSYYENLYNQMTNDGYMMYGLFAFCQGGQLDLTGLDFSKAENASFMFYECNANLQINNKVNTSNLKTAMNMFYRFTNSNNYIDLSAFDFSNVQEAERMFAGCNLNNIDIRNINLNLGNVYQKYNMFNECTGTLDLSNWSIDGVSELQEFFRRCYCTKINLTNWDTINVNYMSNTFSGCPNLQELIIPNWNMDNAYDYWNMFDGCNKLRYVNVRNCNEDTLYKLLEQLPNKSEADFGEIELPEGISQDIIDMAMNKYWKPTSLEATPVTSCNLSVGRSPIAVGESTTVSLSNCDPWYGNKDDIILVSSDEGMIIINGNKIKAAGGVGYADIYAIDNTTQATIGYTSIEVTAEDMNPGLIMFKANDLSLERRDVIMQVNYQERASDQLSYDSNTGVYSLDIGEPITQFRFYNNRITEIVKLNVSNMTNMNDMFNRCSLLKEIDANNWVTPSVTEANIFRNCSGLEIADISNWDTSGLKYCAAFLGCNKLHTLRMDNCNYDTINMITQTGDFPRTMRTGTIYCREGSAAGLIAPKGWVFSYVDSYSPGSGEGGGDDGGDNGGDDDVDYGGDNGDYVE